jgi:hypothetical protein
LDAAAELQVFGFLLRFVQIMEDVWLAADLDHYWSHPLNEGWMSYFHRWSSTPSFRRWWPLLAPIYSPGFREFVKDRFKVGITDSTARLLDITHYEAQSVLGRHFSEKSVEFVHEQDIKSKTSKPLVLGPAARNDRVRDIEFYKCRGFQYIQQEDTATGRITLTLRTPPPPPEVPGSLQIDGHIRPTHTPASRT